MSDDKVRQTVFAFFQGENNHRSRREEGPTVFALENKMGIYASQGEIGNFMCQYAMYLPQRKP